MSQLPDKGTPPPGVQERQRRIQQHLQDTVESAMAADVDTEVASVSQSVPPGLPFHSGTNQLIGQHSNGAMALPPDLSKMVRIESSSFILEILVKEVDIAELYISLITGPHVFFSAKTISDFILHIDGKIYPVKWAGGSFKFTNLGFFGISFLRTRTAVAQE